MSELRTPLIGITCEAIPRRKDFSLYDLLCDHRYASQVTRAGGHPVLLPIAHRKTLMRRYMEGIDGLVIVGGDDLDPGLYGETPRKTTRVAFIKRTLFESWLYRVGRRKGLPILGICYGMQLINVLEGGTLFQHIRPKRSGPRVDHRGVRSQTHSVRVVPGTKLARHLGTRKMKVATEHHQAIRRIAPSFTPAAVAEDGIIEAIENPSRPQIFAVQWHPERLPDSVSTRKLFRAFVRASVHYRGTMSRT